MSEDQDAPRFPAHALRSVGEAKPSKYFKFLIVTPLLEFPVTPTKHSPIAISNRYKMSFLRLGCILESGIPICKILAARSALVRSRFDGPDHIPYNRGILSARQRARRRLVYRV